MDKTHSLLRRQLKKFFGTNENIPKEFQAIAATINEAYINFDEDRLLLERSIDISSQELVQANSQLRSTLQAIPDLFLRIDANGQILECKMPAENTFKHISLEGIVGKSIYSSFEPHAANQLEWAVRRVLKNKTAKVAEFSTQAETERFYEARVVWLAEDQLVVIVRDITERKRSEERLRESQRALQTLMSNLQGLAYRCRNDHDRTMEFVSEGCVNLAGYQPADLINNCKLSYSQLIHPDDNEQVWNTVQDALKERKPYQLTYRIITAGGEQKWVWEQGRGVFSPNGELLALEGFISDITDRTQMQKSLEERERFLTEVFSSIQDGISVLDTSLNIVRINTTIENWYAHAMPVAGKKCYEAYHGRKTPCPNCPTRRTLETGKADYEVVPKTGSGGKVAGWLDLFSFPLVDATTGKIKGAIEYVRDITARKIAEQKQAELLKELNTVNQELNEFASIVSHSLRTPLRGVKALSDWFAGDYSNKLDNEGKEQARLLAERVNRIQNLMNGILQYSEIGRIREQAVPIDLNQFLPQIIKSLAPPSNIHITIENRLPVLVSQPTLIQQVFQNLLNNAVGFMNKPEGFIKVGCTEENEYWKFSVSDNGPGIDEQYFEKIFKIFQTFGAKDQLETTGVGLTTARKTVELYGGKIWLESKLGQGSTFFFTLPKSSAEDSATVTVAVAAATEPIAGQ